MLETFPVRPAGHVARRVMPDEVWVEIAAEAEEGRGHRLWVDGALRDGVLTVYASPAAELGAGRR